MKPVKTYTVIFLLLTIKVLYSQPFQVPHGDIPIIDGEISTGEWTHSLHLQIASAGRWIDFFLKHDNANLYIAVDLKNDNNNNLRFPEILFDTYNNQSTTWMSDDWWFHVSATDCYSIGEYANYDSCEVVHNTWIAIPNFGFEPNSPLIDTIEISIPFTFINNEYDDTIGFALVATNTVSQWQLFPTNAATGNPSTWSQLCFEHPVEVPQIKKVNIIQAVMVSPINKSITVNFKNKIYAPLHFSLIDMKGNIVQQFNNINAFGCDMTNLRLNYILSGIYILELKTSTFTEKIKISL